MRKNNKKLLSFVFLMVLIVPIYAQNVLDNLRLAEKMDIYFETSKFNLTHETTTQLQQIVAK